MNHSLWMQKALALSLKSRDQDEVPVGALLIAEGQVIGKGGNRREGKQSVLGHAEIQALENYSRKFKSWRLPPQTTLYVPLEPCLMCTGALLQARVARVVFATTDTKSAGLTFLKPLILENKFDHKIDIIQLLEFKDPASQLVSQYFKMKRQSRKSRTKANSS